MSGRFWTKDYPGGETQALEDMLKWIIDFHDEQYLYPTVREIMGGFHHKAYGLQQIHKAQMMLCDRGWLVHRGRRIGVTPAGRNHLIFKEQS